MKIIIAGSRSVTDYKTVEKFITITHSAVVLDEIVSGCALGVDKFGEQYAKQGGIPVAKFPANWGEHGKSAGFIRNKQMADYADALIAIWNGESRGTKHMIDTMLSSKKPVFVWFV